MEGPEGWGFVAADLGEKLRGFGSEASGGFDDEGEDQERGDLGFIFSGFPVFGEERGLAFFDT